MDVNEYIAQVEQGFDNADVLERLRDQAMHDRSLDEQDREAIDGRIGTYLADLERQEQPEQGWDPESAPEDGDAGA